MHPRKLYVEITTRCNMQCGMCIKHAPGSTISNQDMEMHLFHRLADTLPLLDTLILNGIGEPLLHPQLTGMVAYARERMRPGGTIGFQTNGLLLDQEITKHLLGSGLNTLCISVDNLQEDSTGSSLFHRPISITQPFTLARSVATSSNAELQLGAEIVLTRKNVSDLPQMVSLMAAVGVDFILCSNLTAYTAEQQNESIFSPVTRDALDLYHHFRARARAEGIDLANLTAKTWIAPRRQDEHKLQNLYKEMLKEARSRSLWLDVPQLDAIDLEAVARYQDSFDQAYTVARQHGITLSLPPLFGSETRSCKFIEEKATCIDVNGAVMPCNPLWHSHRVFMREEPIHISARPFGRLQEHDLRSIWQSEGYTSFRNGAAQNDFPFCHSCSLGPCGDIAGESEPFVNDCFGTEVPCGHCLWSFDAIRCL